MKTCHLSLRKLGIWLETQNWKLPVFIFCRSNKIFYKALKVLTDIHSSESTKQKCAALWLSQTLPFAKALRFGYTSEMILFWGHLQLQSYFNLCTRGKKSSEQSWFFYLTWCMSASGWLRKGEKQLCQWLHRVKRNTGEGEGMKKIQKIGYSTLSTWHDRSKIVRELSFFSEYDFLPCLPSTKNECIKILKQNLHSRAIIILLFWRSMIS